MDNVGWFGWSMVSAFTWACVLIIEKTCVSCLDPRSIAMIRCLIIFMFLLSSCFFTDRPLGLGSLEYKTWLAVSLAGLCGALSWLSYFIALKVAPVSKVSVLDSLSIIFVILFAHFIGEPLTWTSVGGIILFTLGSVLIVM